MERVAHYPDCRFCGQSKTTTSPLIESLRTVYRPAAFLILIVTALAMVLPAQTLRAQPVGSVYLQIEAQPTLSQAQAAAAGYAANVAGVAGYQVPGGWYAITVGPFADRDAAEQQLRTLRQLGAVPADSFIVGAARLGQRYYPVGAAPEAPNVVQVATEAPEPQPVPALPDETVSEARASERLLDGDARRALQEALQWDGFYTSAIDGAIGPGTRRAMSLWQASRGYPETGVLTTRQRGELLDAYAAVFARLGLETVFDPQAGIELLLPLGLMTRDAVEPPFVRYTDLGDSGFEGLLISQEGDQQTLFGLYDIMQTLKIVPADGDRSRRPTSFTLTGQDSQRHSYTYATLSGGAVKGFTLVWPPEDDRVMSRVIEHIQDSFDASLEAVLPDVAGSGQVQSIDLVAGLEIRRPIKSRSALWVDKGGQAVTSLDLLDPTCNRYTLDTDFAAQVVAQDADLGLALLAPEAALRPPAVASLRDLPARLRSEVALAGFSFEGRLDLPSVTFGQIDDNKGLSGEPSLLRLSVDALPGDAGGPVFDGSGSVTGLLQAPATGARSLPGNVRFAVSSDALSGFLAQAGVTAPVADAQPAPMAPEDLANLAADAVVLASCWE